MEMEDQHRLRLFVAIPLPSEVKDVLTGLQSTLKASTGDAVRWTPREQMHLTLLFLGGVPHSQLEPLQNKLQEACASGQSLTIRAQGLGYFPNARKPQVIWCGVEGEIELLQKIQKHLQEALRPWCERIETRPFHPHLTLGRLRQGSRAPKWTMHLQSNSAKNFGEWLVTGCSLIQSKLSPHGSVHSELLRVNLPPPSH
ncbi:MAG TPA: RNA 2',3'-cyclic phosphodiesterase [Candidatus Saccharimonadales bacterium]|nr:RNA 2',3'-cyclic phosphodiesterase [Candidatus Saccharimonadales bacterium]